MNIARVGAALIAGSLGCAQAQDYPAKPVRIIVPLAPGGLGDQLTRILSTKVTPATKQPVIVENRTGAGGIVGAEAAARAAPDGYTLFTGLHNTQAILPHLYAKLSYDPVKDFSPIVMMGTAPNVLVVHPALPVRSVKELVALARARKGDLTYASQGVGSSGHIAAELFKLAAKVNIVHVPYKGAAPANQDLMGGHVMMMFDIAPFALPNMRAGKVRALAVATGERLAVAPELPTMAEAGMPDVQGAAWFALFAPAGTPRAAIDWWNREARRVFAEADTRERFVSQGAVLPQGTPEQLAAFVAADSQRWGRVIRAAGIKLE